MIEFQKVSRWLWQSTGYSISALGDRQFGRWKVSRHSGGMVGYADTLDDAMALAEMDWRTQLGARDLPEGDLTGGHGHVMMEPEETTGERTPDMALNLCKCYSHYTEAEQLETGDTVRTWEQCGYAIPHKRTFKPGHDAKYKSALLWAFRKGVPFLYKPGDSQPETSADPLELAKERGWGHFMTHPKAKKVKIKAKKVKVEADADEGTTDPTPTPTKGFHPLRVKVGRSIKDAILISVDDGDKVTVQYSLKKSGPPQRKQVDRSAVVEGLEAAVEV